MKMTTMLTLPRSHPSAEKYGGLVSRYKSFRLLSLRLSPSSFGSTYAREAAFPPKTWTSRLSSPDATTVVAVSSGPSPRDPASGEDHDVDLALGGEWQASLTISGP